jgi:hypothetical protein
MKFPLCRVLRGIFHFRGLCVRGPFRNGLTVVIAIQLRILPISDSGLEDEVGPYIFDPRLKPTIDND